MIDTNVLVYAFNRSAPDKRVKAMKLILDLQTSQLGCLSIQCLSEFFNATTRGNLPILPFNEALQHVQDYSLAFPIYPLTTSIVLQAARGVRDHSLSFFDAQIWASALINDVQTIFSEDFSDGQVIEGVHFINPFLEKFRLEQWIQ